MESLDTTSTIHHTIDNELPDDFGEVYDPYCGYNRKVSRYAKKHKITAEEAFKKIYGGK